MLKLNKPEWIFLGSSLLFIVWAALGYNLKYSGIFYVGISFLLILNYAFRAKIKGIMIVPLNLTYIGFYLSMTHREGADLFIMAGVVAPAAVSAFLCIYMVAQNGFSNFHKIGTIVVSALFIADLIKYWNEFIWAPRNLILSLIIILLLMLIIDFQRQRLNSFCFYCAKSLAVYAFSEVVVSLALIAIKLF